MESDSVRFNAEIIYFIADKKTKEGKKFLNSILKEARSIHGKGFGETYGTSDSDLIKRLIFKLDMNSTGSVLVELKTNFVHDNQWNSVEFGRVMDFITFVPVDGSRDIISGYFLDFSLALADLRTQIRCRYCGKTRYDIDDQDWREGWHLSCGHEFMEESNIDLTYSVPIWMGNFSKSWLPKDRPDFVYDNFKEKKIEVIRRKTQKMVETREKNFLKSVMEYVSKSKAEDVLAQLCLKFAEDLSIFVCPKDPIIYMHHNPYKISFNWNSSPVLSRDQFNTILDYMKKEYVINEDQSFTINGVSFILSY